MCAAFHFIYSFLIFILNIKYKFFVIFGNMYEDENYFIQRAHECTIFLKKNVFELRFFLLLLSDLVSTDLSLSLQHMIYAKK